MTSHSELSNELAKLLTQIESMRQSVETMQACLAGITGAPSGALFPIATVAGPTLEESFELFWRLFPKREGPNPKHPAKLVWLRLRPSPAQVTQIMAGLTAHSVTWIEPRYIPHARTWLSQRRWEDTVEAPPTARPPVGAGKQHLQKNNLTARTNEVLAGLGVIDEREHES